MKKFRSVRWFALICAAASVLLAQEFRATVTGRITDPSDAPVPGASVVVKNLQTNEEQTVTTGQDGDYTVPFLRPGDYSASVTAAGFKTAIKDKFTLFVNSKTTLDFKLEVGPAQESVTVSAEAPLLEASTASRGGVIENLRITELPLNGRNPFMLATLTTGVQFAGNPQFTRPFDNGDNVNFSINGGLRQTNSYLLDGTPNEAVTDATGDRTRSSQNIAYIPSVDTTQEFKIVTNFYDSQYGRTGGGIMSVSTKSGTNDFHGSAYEFLRRYQLDANDIASNRQGLPRYKVDPITKENLGGHKLDQYGFVLNGPVVIPKLYNGKNRTFWMAGWEDYIESTPSPILTSVPSAAERNGDFSQTGLTIYNPFSTRANPNYNPGAPASINNPQFIRDPFPNNVIPQNLINPVGRAILNAYPTPNVGAANDRFNNFIASPNLSEDRFKNWIARVDQNFGERQRMFFRFGHNRRNQIDNGANGYTGIGRDAQDPLVRINDNAVVDSVTVISPATLLSLRAGYTRFVQAAYRQSVMPFDATQLGFPSSFSNARFTSIPPRISMEQYPDFGSRNPNSNITNLLSGQASLQHIRGRHSLKGGIEYRDYRVNVSGGSFVYGGGQFGFTRAFTQRLPEYTENNSGAATASLLLGTPSGGIIQYVPQLAYRWPYTALFVQDDIRLSQRLTVNLGLRWDLEGGVTERYNRMNAGFMGSAASNLAAAARTANAADCPACANLSGGLQFVNSDNRSPFKNDTNNWQPRIGAAYQLAPRTVLRGGYGIFYLPSAAYGGSAGFAIDTPFVATLGGGVNAFTPAYTLSNPFPNGLLAPTGSANGPATFAGQAVIFNNPNREIPKVHQFSFGVQHQLPWDIRADVSYVGSRSIGINTGDNQVGGTRNINDNTPEQYARARQDPSYFTAQVPNPFAGLLPGTSLNGPTVSRQQLLRPYPQFTSVQIGQEPVGKIWYDSLQTNIEKRFSGGLTTVLAWTWSKNLEAINFLNPYDAEPTRNISAADRTHRLTWSGVYQLPFGRGRTWGGSVNRWTELAIGGWQYTWIVNGASGVPIDLPGNVDLIGNPVVSNQGPSAWFNGCVAQLNGTARQPNAARNGFDTCTNPVWAVRGPNTLRSIPFRVSTLRNPWRTTADMSLNKRFNISERMNFQFRAEAFNVFNTPILRGPNTDPNSPQFGFVAANQSNFPRQIQLGFKFNF